MALKRIRRELDSFACNVPAGFAVGPVGDDLFQLDLVVPGPVDSPYEGAKFFLKVNLPGDYPFKPPKVQFVTKVYHCEVAWNGFMSLDVLHDQWSPGLTIAEVARQIHGMLAKVQESNALIPEILHEYVHNREKHDETARQWVHKYAVYDLPTPPVVIALHICAGFDDCTRMVSGTTVAGEELCRFEIHHDCNAEELSEAVRLQSGSWRVKICLPSGRLLQHLHETWRLSRELDEEAQCAEGAAGGMDSTACMAVEHAGNSTKQGYDRTLSVFKRKVQRLYSRFPRPCFCGRIPVRPDSEDET